MWTITSTRETTCGRHCPRFTVSRVRFPVVNGDGHTGPCGPADGDEAELIERSDTDRYPHDVPHRRPCRGLEESDECERRPLPASPLTCLGNHTSASTRGEGACQSVDAMVTLQVVGHQGGDIGCIACDATVTELVDQPHPQRCPQSARRDEPRSVRPTSRTTLWQRELSPPRSGRGPRVRRTCSCEVERSSDAQGGDWQIK